MREALELAARDFGIDPKDFPGLANPTPFPHAVGYIWKIYLDLQSGEPLSYVEIQAWEALTGTPVLGCEAKALIDLDRTKWSVAYE